MINQLLNWMHGETITIFLMDSWWKWWTKKKFIILYERYWVISSIDIFSLHHFHSTQWRPCRCISFQLKPQWQQWTFLFLPSCYLFIESDMNWNWIACKTGKAFTEPWTMINNYNVTIKFIGGDNTWLPFPPFPLFFPS